MDDLLHDLYIPHACDVPLAPHTWYRLGGPARILAHPRDAAQLSSLVKRCHDTRTRFYVLGSGANLLVADEGVDGVVIRLDAPAFSQVTIDGTRLVAGAGADLMKLVMQTARAGLAGLEVLAGIPATVGGAVRMNAGGAHGDIGQNVRRVRVMDETGEAYDRFSDDLVFEYRRTNIVAPLILEAEFELEADDPQELSRRVKEIFFYKKSTQPMGENSPGCAFKNPSDTVGASAGKLIDDAGLKGYAHGGAMVSQQHANFIVARDGATAADVIAVLEHVQNTVFEKTGVKLQREVVIWP